MGDAGLFRSISPTTLADLLGREQVMSFDIRPLWPSGRVAGPAFTVRSLGGDMLMVHAAIYQAPAGSIVVIESNNTEYALLGGNVSAVAQRRGIAGVVTDGVIRDVAEVRDLGFPIFAKGVVPIPGTKNTTGPLNGQICCGGVTLNGGDIVVADEEGIVVVPAASAEQVLLDALAITAKEASESLDDWERAHAARISARLRELGYEG